VPLYAVTKVLGQIWGPLLPGLPPAGGYGDLSSGSAVGTKCHDPGGSRTGRI